MLDIALDRNMLNCASLIKAGQPATCQERFQTCGPSQTLDLGVDFERSLTRTQKRLIASYKCRMYVFVSFIYFDLCLVAFFIYNKGRYFRLFLCKSRKENREDFRFLLMGH